MATNLKIKKLVYEYGAIDEELWNVIEDNNLSMICDKDVNILMTEEDWEQLKQVAPAVIDDFIEIN